MSTTVSYKGNTLTTVSNNTKTLETEGKYLEADIILTDVSQSAPTLETVTKSYTPTESQQTETITPSVGYDGIAEVDVTVGAISSSYVGTGITRRDGTDVTFLSESPYYGYVSVPTGYYQSDIVKQITRGSVNAPSTMSSRNATVTVDPSQGTVTLEKNSVLNQISVSEGWVFGSSSNSSSVTLSGNLPMGSAGTPTATKSAVSNNALTVTPSVTNTTGYITGSTINGTAVTVSASELVSGSETKTENGTYDVTNLAEIVVDVSGGSAGLTVGTATATPSTASSSISFTGLNGEPTSFYVVSASDLATGAAPYKVNAVVFDGTNVIGQYITNTSNANETYDGSGFSKSYSSGTLTITSTNANFQANQYKLVYTYGGNSANLGTAQVQVGSGATSITFTGLTEEPTAWSCLFTSNIGTSSGYTRTLVVVNDGTSIYGMEMGSSALATSNWSASYSSGSLTISSSSTSAGGYFHQPGYYQLSYCIGGEVTIDIEPLTVTQNGTYQESGKAYSPVTVNVSGGGSLTVATKTLTNTAVSQTLSFTSLSGQPKYWFCRVTSNVSSSGSTTYYYVTDCFYDGTSVKGNTFRIGSTRRVQNVTSGITQSYSGGTLTITAGSSAGSTPGRFYGASGIGYELVYIY